jgi:hypothetical protein
METSTILVVQVRADGLIAKLADLSRSPTAAVNCSLLSVSESV